MAHRSDPATRDALAARVAALERAVASMIDIYREIGARHETIAARIEIVLDRVGEVLGEPVTAPPSRRVQ